MISEKLKIVNNLEDYVLRKEAVSEKLRDEINTNRGRLSKVESDLSQILERSNNFSICNEDTVDYFRQVYLKFDNVMK